MPPFEKLIPALVKAYDETPATNPLKATLAGQIALLRAWDFRSSVSSVPTALAILWGQDLLAKVNDAARAKGVPVPDFMVNDTTAQHRLEALARVSEKLERDFGTWKVAWGEINRFQRLTGGVEGVYDDTRPSVPIGFAPSVWGSLPAFSPAPGAMKTKKSTAPSATASKPWWSSARA